MKQILEAAAVDSRMAAEMIVDSIPDGDYATLQQPTYSDRVGLVDAVHELANTSAVTTPRNVDALQDRLTAIATGAVVRRVSYTGACAEGLDASVSIEELTEADLERRDIVLETAGEDTEDLSRSCGQLIKPRSSQYQELAGGGRTYSFMGPGVNGLREDQRTPDPRRLVAGAVQSRDLSASIAARLGGHAPKAHEALSLAYEMPFVRIDDETGEPYLLSADLPWIGKRTNALDGPHVRLLGAVRNPVGVKIGADTHPDDFAAYEAALNPDDIPGKVTYMIRVGNDAEAARRLAGGMARHAPLSMRVFDLHGSTRQLDDGTKIRYTGDIIRDVGTLAEACGAYGLVLHGVHLETTMDDRRLECVDAPDQRPTHPGHVDPGLNPRQLRYVMNEVGIYLP